MADARSHVLGQDVAASGWSRLAIGPAYHVPRAGSLQLNFTASHLHAHSARANAASARDRTQPPLAQGATEMAKPPFRPRLPVDNAPSGVRAELPVRFAPINHPPMHDAHRRIRSVGRRGSGSHSSAAAGGIALSGQGMAATNRHFPQRGHRLTTKAKRKRD